MTSVILKTGRFDNLDSAVIISNVSKAGQNGMCRSIFLDYCIARLVG